MAVWIRLPVGLFILDKLWPRLNLLGRIWSWLLVTDVAIIWLIIAIVADVVLLVLVLNQCSHPRHVLVNRAEQAPPEPLLSPEQEAIVLALGEEAPSEVHDGFLFNVYHLQFPKSTHVDFILLIDQMKKLGLIRHTASIGSEALYHLTPKGMDALRAASARLKSESR